ncbi:MAG TPA: 6,7-dimethyl-8-ribityllumazine synthase [Gaiellales bacterium]|jgi:6,7-dimethyl-8-ribityllumazine synthase|nr:6,7-dimethyl-8-ribityllumazine synthase [Gaiellales bacterium]
MSEAGAGQLRIPEGCATVASESPSGAVAIAASRFNAEVVQRLLDGAVGRLDELQVPRDQATVVLVPGAWELPLACRRLAASGRYQALVSLGCVVRGGTPHFQYVCSEAARGIAHASLETGVPIGFGVLTCDTHEQALERSGGRHGNKGAEAVDAALEMAGLLAVLPGSG